MLTRITVIALLMLLSSCWNNPEPIEVGYRINTDAVSVEQQIHKVEHDIAIERATIILLNSESYIKLAGMWASHGDTAQANAMLKLSHILTATADHIVEMQKIEDSIYYVNQIKRKTGG